MTMPEELPARFPVLRLLPRRALLFPAILILACSLPAAESLIGRRPPPWTATHWLNSPPLQLSDLAGKVVLIRWWTAPGCPYCTATAPALAEFRAKYRKDGFEVIGFYHHKSARPLDPADVALDAKRLGFAFPVAIDPGWQTLNEWWLDRGRERWTSVSFLLDRDGVVRFIHPGGEYVKGDRDYAELQAKIEELLARR